MFLSEKKKAKWATTILKPVFDKLAQNEINIENAERDDGLLKPSAQLTYNGTHIFYALCERSDIALARLESLRGMGHSHNIENYALCKGLLLCTLFVSVTSQVDTDNFNYVYSLIQTYMA